jgi:ligand-binding sensor domain-containing protein
MNRKTGSFTQYYINPNDTCSFCHNMITAILEDKTGKMWIGSAWGGGVYLFNRGKQYIQELSYKYGC